MSYDASANAGAVAGNPAVTMASVVGRLWFVFCAAKDNTNLTPTCSDNNGGTYTLITAVAYNSGADTFSVFSRDQKTINTVSTTVTVDIGANTNAEAAVVACTFVYHVGSAALRSSGSTENIALGATPAATLNQSALTGNVTIAALGYDGGGAITPPPSWTERKEVNQSLGASVEIATRDSGFTGTTITWGNTAPGPAAAFVMEIDGTFASIAYSGDTKTLPTYGDATINIDGDVKAIALPGSGVNPIPHFYLACYDTNNIRHYWVDYTVSLTNAPDPAPYSYISSTLVILSKF